MTFKKMISNESQIPQRVLLTIISALLTICGIFLYDMKESNKEVVILQRTYIEKLTEVTAQADNNKSQISENKKDIEDLKKKTEEISVDTQVIRAILETRNKTE